MGLVIMSAFPEIIFVFVLSVLCHCSWILNSQYMGWPSLTSPHAPLEYLIWSENKERWSKSWTPSTILLILITFRHCPLLPVFSVLFCPHHLYTLRFGYVPIYIARLSPSEPSRLDHHYHYHRHPRGPQQRNFPGTLTRGPGCPSPKSRSWRAISRWTWSPAQTLSSPYDQYCRFDNHNHYHHDHDHDIFLPSLSL